MSRVRRRVLMLSAAVLGSFSGLAAASDYPSMPITILIPWGAGSTTDVIARLLAPLLQKSLGQPIIIQNRPGAVGTIGTAVAARSKPDGYTVLFTSPSYSSSKVLYPDIAWDPVKSFSPVIMVGYLPNVFAVKASAPYKTLADLIADVKAHPGKYSYGATGVGASPHLTTEMLKQMTGMDIQMIPYKGSPESFNALMSSEVLMAPLGVLIAEPQIRNGTLRGLAVTSSQRLSVLPNVPTVMESGLPTFDVRPWQAVFLPAGTPPAIVNKLNAAFKGALVDPEIKARLAALGLQMDVGTPDDLGKFIVTDVARWTQVIKQGNIKVQ